jgi:AraC-like DNA-binding protein
MKLESGSYFGSTRHLYGGTGLSVAETIFEGECDLPPHEHENPFFCLVLNGMGTRSWQGKLGAEAPMALTVFPAEVPHANHWYGDGGQVLHVEFSRAWLERLRGAARILERPADFGHGAPVWLARRLLEEARTQDDASPLIMEGLALELLGECSRAPAAASAAGAPRWLAKARTLMQERHGERLSLETIAEYCAVSSDHLARAFRRHYGTTVGDHLRSLRIDAACRALAETERSLAEIALAAGFTDQSHFGRVFQRHMRMPPGAFRRLHTK